MKLSRHFLIWLALNLSFVLFAGQVMPLLAQRPVAVREIKTSERDPALRRDALRLVELSVDLHKEIEKSNENVLSLSILRKAEEVERLAHELHERAKE